MIESIREKRKFPLGQVDDLRLSGVDVSEAPVRTERKRRDIYAELEYNYKQILS